VRVLTFELLVRSLVAARAPEEGKDPRAARRQS